MPSDPQTPARVGVATNDDTPKSLKSGTSILYFHDTKPTLARDPTTPHWVRDFVESHSSYNGTIQQFLKEHVPMNRKTRGSLPKDFFDNAIKEKEEKTAPALTELLDSMMERFPKRNRMKFRVHQYHVISPLSPSAHETKPDIVGGFPRTRSGQQSWDWSDTHVVIELKSNASDDPINHNGVPKGGEGMAGIITQLAKNGRNLLQAHSSCFSFVLGVYGSQMRIFRFDRAGVISSPAFDIKQNGDVVEEFFRGFLKPRAGTKVLGLDPTINAPSKEDMRRMRKEVSRIYKHLGKEELKVMTRTCWWMDINIQEMMGVPEVDWMGEVDGDATAHMEDRVQEEEEDEEEKDEEEKDEEEEDEDEEGEDEDEEGEDEDEEGEEEEEEKVDDDEDEEGEEIGRIRCFTFGVPLYESSGLFSRATLVRRAILDPKIHSSYRGVVFAVKDAWREVTRRSESECYDQFEKESAKRFTGLARCYGSLDLGTAEGPDYGHETRKPPNKNARHRERTLIYPVGRPLWSFRGTRELIAALRDAIQGHKIAYECGVLHRDISPGNILILETFEEKDAGGFLHDFDYGKLMNVEGSGDSDTREMTGTFPFMAVDILRDLPHEVHHDLESFYWTLIYIILRHTDHDGRPDASQKLFDRIEVDVLRGQKLDWLFGSSLNIKGNEPLTQLLSNLQDLFAEQSRMVRKPGTPVTHVMFLEALDKVLELDNWPENDHSLPFPNPNSQAKLELQRQIPHQNSQGQSSGNPKSQTEVSALAAPTNVSSSSKRQRTSDHIGIVKSAKTSASSGTRRNRTAVEDGILMPPPRNIPRSRNAKLQTEVPAPPTPTTASSSSSKRRTSARISNMKAKSAKTSTS